MTTREGIGSGHDYARQNYEQVLPLLGSLELTSAYTPSPAAGGRS